MIKGDKMSATNHISLIAIDEFCLQHNIEHSFISSLHHSGMIRVTFIEKSGYIEADQLEYLEKVVRLYYDLDINLEGIETIIHLLDRLQYLQNEIIKLNNTLNLYESD